MRGLGLFVLVLVLVPVLINRFGLGLRVRRPAAIRARTGSGCGFSELLRRDARRRFLARSSTCRGGSERDRTSWSTRERSESTAVASERISRRCSSRASFVARRTSSVRSSSSNSSPGGFFRISSRRRNRVSSKTPRRGAPLPSDIQSRSPRSAIRLNGFRQARRLSWFSRGLMCIGVPAGMRRVSTHQPQVRRNAHQASRWRRRRSPRRPAGRTGCRRNAPARRSASADDRALR